MASIPFRPKSSLQAAAIESRIETPNGAMETLNTELDPKKMETSPKWIFLRRFLLFKKLLEIPQIQFLEEFPVFFYLFPWLSDFGLSGSYIVEGFPNIYEGFPSIFDPFPHYLGPFPVYRKSLKFSVCWSVSSFFRSVSGFQKKL